MNSMKYIQCEIKVIKCIYFFLIKIGKNSGVDCVV